MITQDLWEPIPQYFSISTTPITLILMGEQSLYLSAMIYFMCTWKKFFATLSCNTSGIYVYFFECFIPNIQKAISSIIINPLINPFVCLETYREMSHNKLDNSKCHGFVIPIIVEKHIYTPMITFLELKNLVHPSSKDVRFDTPVMYLLLAIITKYGSPIRNELYCLKHC